MYRSLALSSAHFASSWRVPDGDALNDREAVNQLALTYANRADGAEKEAAFLSLTECFHPYLMKYLNMIAGRCPSLQTRAGKDAVHFLKYLLPAGSVVDNASLIAACRSLHLAFKQQTTDDVYDTLVLCFLRGCRKYDPHYTDKIKSVCEVIDAKRESHFSVRAISEAVGFDAARCMRLLVRKGFLASVYGAKKAVVPHQRGSNWPPPAKFFAAGPVGFTYFIQKWFRYYLNDYVTKAMDELESKAGVLQLDYRGSGGGSAADSGSFKDLGLPHADGNLTDAEGRSWATDTALMNHVLDISEMTESWVKSTDDRLFRDMVPRERYLLQLIFLKEFTWVDIGAILSCQPSTARKQFDRIMADLRTRAGIECVQSTFPQSHLSTGIFPCHQEALL